MLLAISFSGIFKPIGNIFKGLSSEKFASIIDKVVMPLAGIGLAIKGAKSPQSLPGTSPVQPSSAAPNTPAADSATGSAGTGASSGKPWYTNPVVYLGGAGFALVLALVLTRGRGR